MPKKAVEPERPPEQQAQKVSVKLSKQANRDLKLEVKLFKSQANAQNRDLEVLNKDIKTTTEHPKQREPTPMRASTPRKLRTGKPTQGRKLPAPDFTFHKSQNVKSFEDLMEFNLAPQIRKLEKDLVALRYTQTIFNRETRKSRDNLFGLGSLEAALTQTAEDSPVKKGIILQAVVHKGVTIPNPMQVLKKKGVAEPRKVQFDI